jgi:hypothetical protein
MIGPIPSKVSQGLRGVQHRELAPGDVVVMSSFRDRCRRQALAVRPFQTASGLRNVRSRKNGIETHS